MRAPNNPAPRKSQGALASAFPQTVVAYYSQAHVAGERNTVSQFSPGTWLHSCLQRLRFHIAPWCCVSQLAQWDGKVCDQKWILLL